MSEFKPDPLEEKRESVSPANYIEVRLYIGLLLCLLLFIVAAIYVYSSLARPTEWSRTFFNSFINVVDEKSVKNIDAPKQELLKLAPSNATELKLETEEPVIMTVYLESGSEAIAAEKKLSLNPEFNLDTLLETIEPEPMLDAEIKGVSESLEPSSFFADLDSMLDAKKSDSKGSGLLLTANDAEPFNSSPVMASSPNQVLPQVVSKDIQPEPYDGWSYQQEVLPIAPDFESIYKPDQLNEVVYRDYISRIKGDHLGYEIVHTYPNKIVVKKISKEGQSGQQELTVSMGESAQSRARDYLDQARKFKQIEDRTYQSLANQLDHLSSQVLTQELADWPEVGLVGSIDSSLIRLPQYIRGWRKYDESSVPGSQTYKYYNDKSKRVVNVTFANRDYLVGAEPAIAEMINGYFWYQIPYWGTKRYLWFPNNAPSHKMFVNFLSSKEDNTMEASNFSLNDYDFVEFLFKKYGARQLPKHSWEFWSY